MTAPQTILMLRFGAIGNALVSIPAIRAIRRAWPDAKLILIGDPVTLELMEPCPWLDGLVRYNPKGPEKAGPGYARMIMRLRALRPTHSIHFRRFLRSELIGFLSGARERVGFTDTKLQFLTRKTEYEEGVNIIELNLRLARALGISADDRRMEYWPRPSPRVDEAVAKAAGTGPLAVIHPAGSTQRDRLWPHFSALAKILKNRSGARIIFLGASGEADLVKETAAALGREAATAIGLPLPEAAELIRRADVFAGTDSGPAHLADAVGTPGAIIYAPHRGIANQLAKWKPEGARYLAFTPPVDCRDCPSRPCPPDKQRDCAAKIDPALVAEGLLALIK